MRLLRFVQQIYKSSKFYKYGSYHTLKRESSQLITEVKDLYIPMPYGKLAAKAWGQESGKPVLAIPGHQGNCTVYDKLIPLLNNQFYIVAVDCPGQGQSSHRPHGSIYSQVHDLLDYRRAIDYLGWKKFNILGYSLGGGIGTLFCSIFPHFVEKIAVVEKIKFHSYQLSDFPEIMSKDFNTYWNLEKNLLEPPQVRTYEDLISGFKKFSNYISMESINLVLPRNLRTSDCGNGFILARDIRASVLTTMNLTSHELLYQYLSGVKSEFLMINAKNANPDLISDVNDNERVMNVYAKNSRNFRVEYIEGNHFVLLDYPERVAPLINEFLGD